MANKCNECDYVFESNEDEINHKELHTGIIGLICGSNLSVGDREQLFSCHQCEKRYKDKKNLNRHIKSVHQNVVFVCNKCTKEFARKINMQKHEKTCEELQCHECNQKVMGRDKLRQHVKERHERVKCNSCPKTFNNDFNRRRHENSCEEGGHVCVTCNKKCVTKRGLQAHMITHQVEEVMEVSKEYSCRFCNGVFPDKHELYLHRRIEHFQTGGSLQKTPWGDDEAPWINQDSSIDVKLKTVYEANSGIILEGHRKGPIETTYNFPISNEVTIDYIIGKIEEIYEDRQHSFKFNLMFGFIMKNRENDRYRYYIPYYNNAVFELPVYVSRRSDLVKIKSKLEQLDITSEILKNRPDTKWIPVLLTNLNIHVFDTSYPIGMITNIPDHLRKESIYLLIKNEHNGKPYRDNLCAFRCVALHKGCEIGSLEVMTKILHAEWMKYKPSKIFKGVLAEEIPEMESLFKINVEAYDLGENGNAVSIYKSRRLHDTTLYVNIYQNHMMYIRDFSKYASKFQCKTCDQHFNKAFNAHRHQKTCSEKTKYIYPGGFYKPMQNIFQKLEEHGIYVSENDRTFPWFICYDFEALIERIDDRVTDSLNWIQKHIPISVSICSNVDGHEEAICIVESDVDTLISKMINKMREIAVSVEILAIAKWESVIEDIKNKLEEEEADDDDDDDDDDEEEDKITPLSRLYGQFNSYIKQTPILGFNSSNYDLNLIKKYVAKHLNLHCTELEPFVVKKNNSYLCIASENLKFMDISHFLAQGSSYSKFLKAYDVTENKGKFPYEWFDDESKLFATTLPPHESFYNHMTDCNISTEEYEQCVTVWNENNMRLFKDYLVWYNNLDVKPFVTAVERLQSFYFKKNIDVLKTAISVPGISRQLLFSAAREKNVNFALFGFQDTDLYETVKRNVIGGPSIIYHRFQQANKTRIRGDKLCKSILGFDANALYLHCFEKLLPTGPYIRRISNNDFKPEVRDKYMSAYYYMDWIAKTNKISIHHKLNQGYEVRIGKYPVDGFVANQNQPTVIEFNGCYTHAHTCELTKDIKNEKWLKRRDATYKRTIEKMEYLQKRGYKVETMWECDFKKYCREHPAIYEFINSKRPQFYRRHRGKTNEEQILRAVLGETLFGMCEIDIHVPEDKYEYFQEMSPIFCTTEVPFEAIGQHMQNHVRERGMSTKPRRLLVGGMKAEQILIATPLLKWYLNHGMIVTKIYQVIEYQSDYCFQSFVDEVSNARRAGDRDPNKQIIADTMKVIGNSGYGSLIMNKMTHRDIKYIQGEHETCLKINDPLFRKLECLDEEDSFYEIEMNKRRIKLDLPIQLGYFILQYAKLHMLNFYYECLDKYLDRSDFQYCEMDTDSAYIAITGNSLSDVIKPTMMKSYENGLKNHCNDNEKQIVGEDMCWFPRTCCEKHSKFDKRKPGLFKLEFQGDEIIGLCSKTYIVRKSINIKPSSMQIVGDILLRKAMGLKKKKKKFINRTKNEYKFSSKGVTKRRVTAPMSKFRRVIRTGLSESSTNRGFRARNNTIYTYTQEKTGFSYFYCKRKVMDDGVSTEPVDIILSPK